MTNEVSKQHDPTDPIRPRRPVLLTLVFWVFALWTVLGWLRFFQAFVDKPFIILFLPDWAFGYLLAAGLVWGLVGLPVLWGLIRGAAWTLKILPVAALVYPVIYWLERLLLWRDPAAQSNWPFMFLLTLIWIVLITWVLYARKVKQFFVF